MKIQRGILFALSLIIFSCTTLSLPQISKNQLIKYKSAKTFSLLISENYTAEWGQKIIGVNLDVYKLVKKLFENAGLSIHTGSVEDADLRIEIIISGSTHPTSYSSKSMMRSITQYNSVVMEGKITIKSHNEFDYVIPFQGYEGKLEILVSRDTESGKPSDAPFYHSLFQEKSLFPKLYKIISDIYGLEPIFLSIQDYRFYSSCNDFLEKYYNVRLKYK